MTFILQVTKEDCREALQNTSWDIHKAIKLIKLKQLLSIKLGDVNRCKDSNLLMVPSRSSSIGSENKYPVTKH
ncbi:hypothetical protein DPMN_125115 [Dreissena polymorpha]|uniref:Uncharacterized protein n=1 Tax=Dreissena polymorpha TaxID=45954 RepID=A0A9D4GXL3_DREPO|nr:hypothetical protein DPMN_125115 [Dreissena polymorpha]